MPALKSKRKQPEQSLNPAGMRVLISGPFSVAEFDCHDCPGLSNLTDPKCRRCVLEKLGTEGKVDQVVLSRAYCRVYTSPELSGLARTLAALKQLILDRTAYAESEADKECRKCVDRRMRSLVEVLQRLTTNPHDPSPLEHLADEEAKLEGECEACTRARFLKLIDSIRGGLSGSPILSRLGPMDYDGVFVARTKPFFVEGVWHPLTRKGPVLDCYRLPGGRGMVRIYDQLDRPVPFYELDLPEFKIPAEQLGLLDKAFRVEVEAPGHAKFAHEGRMRDFAEGWYNALLHMVREEEKVSTADLRKLASVMASWLTYRVLEPLSHDDYLTDIYIPAPPELQPITVEHERWGKCETGIYLTTPSLLGLGEILASRLGTSFDEVRPQLDAELQELGMRLFLSRYPAIWQRSVEVAIRKRRSKPWTQPLFLERGTLTPLASSFLSNALRMGASAFVIGEMGTAKTSQVETYVPEIGPEHRIVCFQDTEELHVDEFVQHGYELANVRVSDPEQLEKQVNAFLRGGPSYWLITEVRAAEAVRSALGAAARQGSQPVIASFHARSKREMFDLIVHIMGLHEAAFKYIDFIISTARFSTRVGTVRRIVEIAEVLKDWREEPSYVELFTDDRKRDLLVPKNFLSGDRKLIERLNSYDLSKVDVLEASKKLDLLPPEEGGSSALAAACKRLAIEERDFITSLLAEARMKSDLLGLAERSGDESVLELPFVSRAYGAYFSLVKRHAPDYGAVLEGWRNWLRGI